MPEPIKVRVSSLSYGPDGVGRTTGNANGKVVFVPHSAPGDVLDVDEHTLKQNYSRGIIVTRREDGPARRPVRCRYVPRCGGCSWQHISYSEQARAKEALVRDHLQRIAGLKKPVVKPIIRSPKEWRYRHRIRLRTHPPGGLGFYQAKSRELVELDDCLIAMDGCEKLLSQARSWLRKTESIIRRLELVVGDAHLKGPGGAVLIGNAEGKFCQSDSRWCEEFVRDSDGIRGLLLFGRRWRRAWGDTNILLDLGVDGLTLSVRRGGFTQVNPAGNRALISALLTNSGLRETDTIIECYSGVGNFSIPLASRVRSVISIDQDMNAILDARDNISRMAISNIECIHARVERGLEDIVARGVEADVLVLDPPRHGAAAMLTYLKEMKIPKVVYLSCNPSTLARDLRYLEDIGYRTKIVQPIDLFPQTYHVETIAVAVLT